MDLQIQKVISRENLIFDDWDISIYGKVLDDRGREAYDFITQNSNESYEMVYDAENLQIEFNEQIYQIEDLQEVFEHFSNKKVILECTTLGFVEILLIVQQLKNLELEFSLLYLEPIAYSKSYRPGVLNRREFELSTQITGYKAIPGFAVRLTDKRVQRGVFFLGYESSRLNRAFEDPQMLNPNHCSVIFGVPAFQPGWEMNSFANNVGVVSSKNLKGGVHFVGANNPIAALERLEEIQNGLSKDEMMIIAPIGTKPCSIGAALFANKYENVGVLFDHPQKKSERSTRVANWNIYDLEL